MATAAHNAVLRIGASATPTDDVDGANDATFNRLADLLDTTDFEDTSNFRTRIQGLKDANFSISGDYVAGDTAQTAVRTAYNNGTTVFVRWLPDGTNGFELECHVESESLSGSVDGKAEFSWTLQGTGSISAVP